jgi:hypothetical protein
LTRLGGVLVVLLLASAVPAPAYAQTVATPAPQLTVEQMKEFLKTAKVVRSRTTSKGVTAPKRLTLTDGTITHDAVFQAVDERQMVANLSGRGRQSTTELNFVDSYRYNLAAYALAGLLGLDHMMPVYVERRWGGQVGSISWFVPSMMDESERLKKKIQPPNSTDWNHQMYRMRVFTALLRDTDRNLTNVLITPDWKVVMIDFSRAFRLQTELMYSKDLARIDRNLMTRLEALDHATVKQAVGESLTGGELEAMMKRRDILVAHFKGLIAQLGEEKVLY